MVSQRFLEQSGGARLRAAPRRAATATAAVSILTASSIRPARTHLPPAAAAAARRAAGRQRRARAPETRPRTTTRSMSRLAQRRADLSSSRTGRHDGVRARLAVWRDLLVDGPDALSPLGAGAASRCRSRSTVQRALPMTRGAEGWFEAEAHCGAGARYRYRLGRRAAVPDPASRAQADDVHGPSLVVDPRAYRWRHPDWRGRPWHETVLYELHAGTCGGFAGVQASCRDLAELGVTAVELMPVNDFPGARNWGYDGVLPFAPDAAMARPDELKALVDAAHGLGLMMFLDVVYNHFGPDGNYLARLRAGLLPQRHRTRPGVRPSISAAAGAPLLHRERALLADRIPLRRPALRRRARHRRTPTGSTRWPPRSAPQSSRAATSISCSSTTATMADHLRQRLRRAVERRRPSRPARAADRRERRLLRRLRRPARRAAGALPRAKASSTRASPRPIATASRAARQAPICRRPPSCCSCRTTTRSATARSATG